MVSKTKKTVAQIRSDVSQADSDKICFICANPITVWAIGSCKHPGNLIMNFIVYEFTDIDQFLININGIPIPKIWNRF